jgi:hypothetical protein
LCDVPFGNCELDSNLASPPAGQCCSRKTGSVLFGASGSATYGEPGVVLPCIQVVGGFAGTVCKGTYSCTLSTVSSTTCTDSGVTMSVTLF